MRHLALLLSSSLTLITLACATPLPLRTAQVLRPGEFELTAGGSAYVDRQIKIAGAVAVSGRTGIFQDVDVQLRLNALSSEILDAHAGLGFQVHSREDLKVALTAGLGFYGVVPEFVPEEPTEFDNGSLRFPIALLADGRLWDGGTLTVGATATPIVGWVTAPRPIIAPSPIDLRLGGSIGLSAEFGPVVVRPEFGVDMSVLALAVGVPLPNPQLGLQVGARF